MEISSPFRRICQELATQGQGRVTIRIPGAGGACSAGSACTPLPHDPARRLRTCRQGLVLAAHVAVHVAEV
eukprot:6074293-Heterocapsa_arctica.AAC.1